MEHARVLQDLQVKKCDRKQTISFSLIPSFSQKNANNIHTNMETVHNFQCRKCLHVIFYRLHLR